jgi:purine-binding chemotaxis protein CheW
MNTLSDNLNSQRAAHQQFLTFQLAGAEYGLGILAVQEIRCWSPVTPIPHQPDWVLGVMDLRGVIVPVIDLRRRFELPAATFGPSTVVIVIRVSDGLADRTVGLVVDAVSDVYDIDAAALRELPALGNGATNEVVQGLAYAEGKTLILLDAMRLASTTSAPAAIAPLAATVHQH